MFRSGMCKRAVAFANMFRSGMCVLGRFHAKALRGYFGNCRTVAIAMDAAYTLFRSWCRLHKVNAVHLDSFVSCIPATRNEYPTLGGKECHHNHETNQPHVKQRQSNQPAGRKSTCPAANLPGNQPASQPTNQPTNEQTDDNPTTGRPQTASWSCSGCRQSRAFSRTAARVSPSPWQCRRPHSFSPRVFALSKTKKRRQSVLQS